MLIPPIMYFSRTISNGCRLLGEISGLQAQLKVAANKADSAKITEALTAEDKQVGNYREELIKTIRMPC